jgi:lysozyme family protein
MQKSVNLLGGNLNVDNIMGAKTIKAINSMNAQELFNVYQQNRREHYIRIVKQDPTQKVFIKGWLDRVDRMKFEE